jgi:flagellar protein FlaG
MIMELHPIAGTPSVQPQKAAPLAQPGAPAAAAVKAAAPAEVVAPEPAPADVQRVLGEINKVMQTLGRDIEFSIDTDSQRPVVKVVDQETGEVIRQMPSAEALEIGKALDKVQGLLIRQRA